ncbi:MAG TPA: hypothetical protein IGR64_17735 [Leptolyngbyaceae cyanobacterium M65_K2018_010]|nr:hypothetical protein [Leptolyngbyaceae cyanobacterium M65_K2018_010]
MKVEHPHDRDLTPEELEHLAKLRTLVQEALADGRLSEGEIQSIRSFIHADHKVTVEELRMIRSTLRRTLGDSIVELDWETYQ